MKPEIIIDTIETDEPAYVEVGTEDHPSDDAGRVYLHLEDGDGAVTLHLTADQAYALMAALGQAVRAL